MHRGNCKCFHHWVAKLLVLFAWVSGVLFFWTACRGVIVWGFDELLWFYSIVVFVLLAFSTKFCGCCAKHWMMGKGMSGGMNCACTCNDCNGGKCSGMHNEDHRHQ